MRGWRSLASLSRVLSTIQILHVRKMPFYAVARGHKPGIYESWPECQKQINGFHCARYKKFSTKDEAEEFVQENAASNPVVDRRQLDPALNEMKNKMKRLQKELSVLRSEFDDYVATTCGVHPKFSRKNSSLKPSFAADKRKRDDSSDSDEDSNGPSVVKKLNTGDSGGSDKTKFSTDSDGFLIVYTDGACEFNGRNGAKAGVGFSKVSIHTDSQFMINCMTSWLKNWKKKNWVKSDGEPVKNKEDLIALDAASEDLAVKWVHVKGHAGHEGNEIADKLARQGAKLYKADPDA
ncbi:Ribonuclease H1-like [Homarus americanus]|uniref:Ribonuclease H1 n=1 Tax=Homarus americanus TaxID=6706 RepID=A0A8J5K127_HOMAM|nr:Ribonuclease H1-like [Homarus americanus]